MIEPERKVSIIDEDKMGEDDSARWPEDRVRGM